jgi:hypothetical protein
MAEAFSLFQFLKEPLNKKYFNLFFHDCFCQTIGYLRYLKAKGFALPLNNVGNGNPFHDLAIELLGNFLQSRKDAPFYLIFAYFEKNQELAFTAENTDRLYEHFLILLRKHIRQGLTRLRKQENPQLDNLKRRFKDILSADNYACKGFDNSSANYIYQKKSENNLRLSGEPISYEHLTRISEESYLHSKSRSEWCANIFDMIDSLEEYQNFVKFHELLSAVITVNAKYVEIDGFNPSPVASPDYGLLKEAVEQAKSDSLQWARSNLIEKFIEKGRISPEDGRRFLCAVEKFLDDFGYDGSTDPIPDYYREVMPAEKYCNYLREHKYIFETIISNTLDFFKEKLKTNPTILALGSYLINGK